MKITLVAGARPNFMKVSPIIMAIQKAQREGKAIAYRLVHTGQHYDEKLSKIFFEELNIPAPHVNLEVGSGSQAEQTGRIMMAFEKDLAQYPCDLVVVVGDVNSTMACTIVAKKLNVKVVHVEAGIRSFDMTMPEEVNRIVTDALADYFFTTSKVAGDNLLHNGIDAHRIFLVGNTMIDTLKMNLDKTREPQLWEENQLRAKQYFVLTLHRPSNVDNAATFERLIGAISKSVKNNVRVIFPVHPRTRRNFELINERANVVACEPLGYLEFIHLIKNAQGVITDSGGVQEETTYLGIPCVTLRINTERPETVTEGTNEIIGNDLQKLSESIHAIQDGKWKKGRIPDFWDGNTALRIIDVLLSGDIIL